MTVLMTKREEAESAERVACMGSVDGSGSPYSRERARAVSFARMGGD